MSENVDESMEKSRNEKTEKFTGVILLLLSIGGIFISGKLCYGAFQADKIWKSALMLFGALELFVTAIFFVGVGRAFIHGIPQIENED